MKQTNIERAREIGIVLAKSMFREFYWSNPEYMGKRWNWDKFPNFMYRFANVTCFIYFSYKMKTSKTLKRICGFAARKEAIRLVENEFRDKYL